MKGHPLHFITLWSKMQVKNNNTTQSRLHALWTRRVLISFTKKTCTVLRAYLAPFMTPFGRLNLNVKKRKSRNPKS